MHLAKALSSSFQVMSPICTSNDVELLLLDSPRPWLANLFDCRDDVSYMIRTLDLLNWSLLTGLVLPGLALLFLKIGN
ncbi:hypothetical protein TNIN_285441 [Trichonephila inaurata madagascariensis]|uniref:Uncharacterized protein n=1 Tax=Trichonephila inaurata madagascariensis TaxID=2747483 RepID=A0A8X7BQJ4_9ARAC|nr:hypothetical protein TNIN_285441 [Trichonephila inaurata madagascariensis]